MIQGEEFYIKILPSYGKCHGGVSMVALITALGHLLQGLLHDTPLTPKQILERGNLSVFPKALGSVPLAPHP